MSFVPVVGVPYSIAAAEDDWQNSNYVGAALGVAGIIPMEKLGAKGASWIVDALPAAEESALARTLSHIDAKTVPTDATQKKWATRLKNKDGDLPGGQFENSPYLEYRVAPPAGTSGAGPLRVVMNKDSGHTYYTWTHYGDSGDPAFVRIR